MDNYSNRVRSMSSSEYYQRIGQTTYKRFVKQHDESPENADTVHIINLLDQNSPYALIDALFQRCSYLLDNGSSNSKCGLTALIDTV